MSGEKPDLLHEGGTTSDQPSNDSPLPIHELRGGVGDEVDPIAQRLLEIGRGKAVVDQREKPVLAAELGKPLQIDQLQSGIGGRFDEDHPGRGLDRRRPAFRGTQIEVGRGDPPLGKNLVQDLMGRSKECPRGEQVVSGSEQRPQ